MVKGRTNNGQKLFNGKESNKGQGFDKNPQNINREGAPISIKNQLKKLLESDGRITIPARQVISIEENGDVTIMLPTQDQIAMKLSSLALNKNSNSALKAIEMIMDRFDGKPKQSIDVSMHSEHRYDLSVLTEKELITWNRLIDKITINHNE